MRRILVIVILGMLCGCASLVPQPADVQQTQITHVHKAPTSQGAMVEIAKALVEPANKLIELAGQVLNPVATGFGSALASLGAGLGNAMSMFSMADTATTLVTATGMYADIGASTSSIGDATANAGRVTAK